MKPARILMTGDTVGGVWTFTMELAEQLTAAGSEVCLAAFGGAATDAQKREAAAIRGLRLVSSRAKLEWMDDPWAEVEESRRTLLELAEEYEPDLVHLNMYCHVCLPWRAPVVLTAHSCVATWWAAVKRDVPPSNWDRYRKEVRESLGRADLVTAPSQAMLDALRNSYGVNLRDARVIPNGRSAWRFRRGMKEPLVLSAGRLWDEGKNVEALVGIARRLPWPVYLAGEQRSPDGGDSVAEGCHLLGQLSAERLAEWYARAAIYALPARYEPFGFSALEAALSGCALVLGDIASLREVWGDAAVFVPPDEPAALESALRVLMDSPQLLEEMARRGRERAEEYTMERMGSEYLAAYESVAARSLSCAS